MNEDDDYYIKSSSEISRDDEATIQMQTSKIVPATTTTAIKTQAPVAKSTQSVKNSAAIFSMKQTNNQIQNNASISTVIEPVNNGHNSNKVHNFMTYVYVYQLFYYRK